MKYFKTKDGIVQVCNNFARHFERNFEFEKVFEVTIPTTLTIKSKSTEPYKGVSNKEMLEHLNQVVKEHEYQAKRHKKLIEELDLK